MAAELNGGCETGRISTANAEFDAGNRACRRAGAGVIMAVLCPVQQEAPLFAFSRNESPILCLAVTFA